MSEDLIRDVERRMSRSLELFRQELASLRAGRATPQLLEKVQVDYYGSPVPVQQLATVSVPEPRLIVIQPWDKNALADIERAILKSDLGLTPSSDGNVIRLTVPQLTEQRRGELVRQLRRMAEEERVAIRNLRRDANDAIKAKLREGSLSEDEARRLQDEVQKLTDRFVAQVDEAMEIKEKEIREV